VHFEDAKAPKQQPLPPTVEKGPGKVIPQKQKDGTDSESDSNSSDGKVTFLRYLVTTNALTEAALQKELAKRTKSLKKLILDKTIWDRKLTERRG